ncbi:MAG: SusC/RagA family TonB-linked outer membrane protein [Flavobacteriaceae bacterium]
MKKTIANTCMLLLFSLFSLSGFAQDAGGKINVSGTVVDNLGVPVPGVNVIEKGTNNGAVTDFDGNYVVSVKSNGILVFSFVGMRTLEVSVDGKTTLNATLQEDTAMLDEVVVVGYGSQKKENLTGAIVTIKPENVEELPVSNLSEALRGQVPGLSVSGYGARRPGETSDIQIRQTFGYSKDGNTTFPLVVIDDMVQVDPQTGLATLETFNRLDPSEIESITVLKDASAAIYGSRASQGAIVVKTKRGKAGKTKFTYAGQFAFNDAISHGKTMSAYESGIYNNRFWATNGQTDARYFYSDAELEEMKTLNYDWLDKAWHGAEQQKHTLTVNGGNEKATYFAGINYFTQGANLGDQDYNKWNFRTGINAKITDDLDLSFSVSGNTGEIEKSFTKSSSSVRNGFASAVTNAEQADYGILLHMPKFVPITTIVGGEEYYMSPFPRTDRNLGGNQNTNSSIAGWNYFATLDSGSKQISSDFSNNVNASLSYKVPFVKGMTLRGTYSRNQTSSKTEQAALPFTLARITNFNNADRHLASAADDSNYRIADNVRQARVVYDNTDTKSVQANFFISYEKSIGDHDFDAMVGIERSEAEYAFTRLYYENPGKDYLGTYQTAGTLTTNSYNQKSESGTMSYLGRFNYSYKDKYLFQALFRSDASTKFAPENYWGFFPSLQVGWIMSKEKWFEEGLSWVDYLKLRYSIGKTGKDNIKPWRWELYYDLQSDKGFQFGSNGGLLGNSLDPRVNPNRDIGWDTTIKNNVGLDFNLLDNRLQISADFYYDRTTDMLVGMSGAIDVPVSVGGGFAEENYAATDAWGTEYSVNWSDKIKEDFSYNVGINFGFADNVIKKWPDVPLALESENVSRVGYSSYSPVWGFKTWKGTSTGDGILRTDDDVQNYWNYLTTNATAAGGTPSYFNITDVSNMRKGMLAYQDLGGNFDDQTGIQEGPDGVIDEDGVEDYGKLAKSNRNYGFTTNLGMKYKGLYLKTQIATSWGGFNSIDVVPQYTSTNDAFYARESFWTDMYGPDNLDGKYPSLEFRDGINVPSDFWKVDSFRCVIRNLTVGFQFPEEVLSNLNIQNLSLGLTGYNLWDLYNPYPDKYRNVYDSSMAGYPTLRTWTVNLNVTF